MIVSSSFVRFYSRRFLDLYIYIGGKFIVNRIEENRRKKGKKIE